MSLAKQFLKFLGVELLLRSMYLLDGVVKLSKAAYFGLICIFLIGLVGCTHAMHVSQIEDIQPSIHGQGAVRIKSEAQQFVIMGFIGDTNYVEKAYQDLEAKCPKGVITGITSRYSTSHGFLSWTNKLHMTAWCT